MTAAKTTKTATKTAKTAAEVQPSAKTVTAKERENRAKAQRLLVWSVDSTKKTRAFARRNTDTCAIVERTGCVLYFGTKTNAKVFFPGERVSFTGYSDLGQAVRESEDWADDEELDSHGYTSDIQEFYADVYGGTFPEPG